MTIAAVLPAFFRGLPARGPKRLAGFAVALSAASPLCAYQAVDYTPAERYLAHVPTPESITDTPTASRFVDHAAVTRAFEAICGASDRAELVRYGESWEGRPLLLAMVSSEENLARRAEILAGIARLADPRPALDDEERARLIDGLPAVVWLSYSVHGNEPSGTEAALPVLYHLAAGDDDATRGLLDDVFCVIDPCLNPDGRDRYVNWFRSVSGARPNDDPQAEEHREPWPGGRINHYYFDLNRDWAFLTQAETRARVGWFLALRPQVHVDLHEMFYNSSYFFFPSADPTNENFPPSTLRWGERFGRGNAAAFDEHGWSYYTGEHFDLFYPGYGDSWPSLHGAIGMTYEQGGHSAAGLVIRRADGTELTLDDRTAHHFVASLATLGTASRNRRDLLGDFLRFHEDALFEGANGTMREVLLVPGRDAAPADELAALLLMQGIEVSRAEGVVLAERAHAYPDGDAERRRFPEGTYRVSLEQPTMRLAKALLEPRAVVTGNRFYDVSAWSLPLAFGVEAWWTEDLSDGEFVSLDAVAARTGAVRGDVPPTVGYLVRWDSAFAPRFLDRVSRAGLRLRGAREPFTVGGEHFARGALFVPVRGNPEHVHQVVARAASETGVVAHATSTGWTEDGPDLGSDSMIPLRAPAIALATGEGVSAGSTGATRFLMERRAGVPFSRVPLERLGSIDLMRYDVLILPSGRGVGEALGEGLAEPLRQFVRSGRTVIAFASAARALCDGDDPLVRIKVPRRSRDESASWKTIEERREERFDQAVPGALLRVRLDPEHPLAFGYEAEETVVLMSTSTGFSIDGGGHRLGVFEEGSLVSGFLSEENQTRLTGTAYLAEAPLGRGRVILFADDPTFRGLVRGQTAMLLNAIFQFPLPR